MNTKSSTHSETIKNPSWKEGTGNVKESRLNSGGNSGGGKGGGKKTY